MGPLPQRLYVYLVGCAAGASAALTAAALVGPWWHVDPVLVVSIVAGCVVGLRHPIQLGSRLKLTADGAVLVAAALLLPPAAAMGIAAATTLAALSTERPARIFNAAKAALSVGAGALTYAVLAGPGTPVYGALEAALAAAAVRFGTQTVLVDLAVSMQLGRRPLSQWWPTHRSMLLPTVAIQLIGVLSAANISVLPLIASVLIIWAFHGEVVRSRSRGRAAMRELADAVDLAGRAGPAHAQWVEETALHLADALALPQWQRAVVRDAARFHVIGGLADDTSPDTDLSCPYARSAQLLARASDLPEASGVLADIAAGRTESIEARIVLTADRADALTPEQREQALARFLAAESQGRAPKGAPAPAAVTVRRPCS